MTGSLASLHWNCGQADAHGTVGLVHALGSPPGARAPRPAPTGPQNASSDEVDVDQRRMTRGRVRGLLRTGLGAACALLALDFVLRFFVVGWYYPKTPVREIRQFTEGVATSHFAADGFGTYGHRLTGNAPVAGAPTVMVLGDSHLVQEAVSDDETLGAVIERLSRAAGHPVNVRQYGWYGTAAPTFIASAPELLKAVQPRVVVVVMNAGNLGKEALTDGWYWLMRIHSDLSIELVDVRVPEPKGWLADLREFVGRSSLMLALRRRAVLVFQGADGSPADGAPDPRAAELPLVTKASVLGLKDAYGSRLVIFYAPYCKERCDEKPDRAEVGLLSTCRALAVRCLSTRADMVAYMAAHHRILRGFHNTAPGAGHLNRYGLQVLGTAIWERALQDAR